MVKPISPDEIAEAKRAAIPDYVFEAVNDILARKYTAGSCTITQDDIITEILKRAPSDVTRGFLFEQSYLNFEEAYREAGWKVVYDKPGYNEFYDANFRFSRK